MRLVLRKLHVAENLSCSLIGALTLVTSSPKRADVRQRIASGKLRLVPISQNIQFAKKNKTPSGSLALGEMCEVDGETLFAFIAPYTRTASPAASTQEAVQEWLAPFWFVQMTASSAEANMEFEAVTTKVEGSDWTAGDYVVPMLVNKKVLQEGDVLKYYHNSKQMGSKFPPVEPMPKRQRRG